MLKYLIGLILGASICAIASAQSLDERVIELENRVEQIERKISELSEPLKSSIPQSSQRWRSLKREMTEKQVRAILGEPQRINATGMYTAWEYPSDGQVLFTPSGILRAWTEPGE